MSATTMHVNIDEARRNVIAFGIDGQCSIPFRISFFNSDYFSSFDQYRPGLKDMICKNDSSVCNFDPFRHLIDLFTVELSEFSLAYPAGK